MTAPPADAVRCGFVGLAGWTNVGKSTLLNRLVGQKVAAVADAPQTTRSRILGVRTLPGVVQAIFVDTPGLHRPRHRLNRAMVELARASLRGVDLAVLVVDASRGPGPGDEQAAALLRAAPERPLTVALNKIDRVQPKSRLLPMIDLLVNGWGLREVVPLSALTGEGCDRLLERVLEHLPEGTFLFPEDASTDQPERALAAEWIREKLLRHTRQELPHAIAVLVERWRERHDGVVEIDADILVERESQKGIVIGKGGALLKTVGTEARIEIEERLGVRAFLTLRVTVKRDWRDDDSALRRLGLG